MVIRVWLLVVVQVYVTLRLPVLGEYGLEIYASEPAVDGDRYTHICQYLVAYTERDFGTVYGQVGQESCDVTTA